MHIRLQRLLDNSEKKPLRKGSIRLGLVSRMSDNAIRVI